MLALQRQQQAQAQQRAALPAFNTVPNMASASPLFGNAAANPPLLGVGSLPAMDMSGLSSLQQLLGGGGNLLGLAQVC